MKTLKKLSAILLSVVLLGTLLPTNLAFAAMDAKYYDFEGYTDTSGTGKPAGFGENTPSSSCTILPGSDSVYGTTVKVKMGGSNKQTNINLGLNSDSLPTSKLLTIRTALKNSDKLRAGMALEGNGLAYFGRDGYVYVGTTKTPYTYKVDTWYDLATTVNLTTGDIECVINGDNYTNVITYGSAAAVVGLDFTSWKYLQLGMIGSSDNSLIYENGVVSDNTLEIGYLSLYEGTFSTPEKSYIDTFDYGDVASYTTTETDGSTEIYTNGEEKSMKVVSIGWDYSVTKTLSLPAEGTIKLGISLLGDAKKIGTLGDANLYNTVVNANSGGHNDFYLLGARSNVSDFTAWNVNTWYSLEFEVDITNKKILNAKAKVKGTDTVVAENNTSVDITGDITALTLKTCKVVPTQVTPEVTYQTAYYDDIYVKVEEDIRLQHMDIAPGTTNVFVSEEPTVYFTEEIDPATVNATNVALTVDGAAYADYTPEVGSDGKSIVIRHDNLLAGEKTYTLNISNIAAKDDATDIAGSYSYSFTTAKAYEIGDVLFSGAAAGEAGNVTATVNIKFNDDIAHEVAFIAAVYDKDSGELVTCDIDNRKDTTAVTGSADLTATVTVPDTEGKTYVVYAYLWDGLGTLRPYIAATPLIEN